MIERSYSTSPKRPYLLRAYHDWLLDNNLTPYLVVDAEYWGTKVPKDYVKDGQIVLNISPSATGGLQLLNDSVQFNARFRGVLQEVFIPMGAVLAIYARENGDGVMFEFEAEYEKGNTSLSDQPNDFSEIVDKKASKSKKSDTVKKSSSHLRIIK